MTDVIPEKVTLRRNLTPYFDRKQVGNNHTAFREVSIVSPKRAKAVNDLLNAKIKRENVGVEKFSVLMFEAMKKAILEKWNSSKFHIVQHSSGWDSRLISTAIVSLLKERGKDWLGDIFFVEVSGEHGPFSQIMKLQGWNNEQWTVYNPGAKPQEKHIRSFEFKDAWRKMNGYCCYPVNCNWDAFEWLREADRIPNSQDCQILTGYGANEVGNWVQTGRGLKNYARFIYYHSLSHFPLWGGHSIWIHPFYHLNYIRTWIKYGLGIDPYYRKLVTQRYGKKWAAIQPEKKSRKKKLGYRTITQEMRLQCDADYLDSWLGREVFPQVRMKTNINYHPCWGYWSLASFCDYLLEKGHKIDVA